MITPRDITDAWTICAGYDPIHTPKASEIIVRAWLDHFGHHPRIGREEFLAAMRAFWQVPGRSFPQPAQISALVAELVRAGLRPGEYEIPSIGEPSPIESAATADQRAAHMVKIAAAIGEGKRRVRAS